MNRSTSARFLAAAVAVGLSIGLAPRCAAQEAPRVFEVAVYKIKPDMTSEWENLIKAALPALKKAGVPMVQFWQTAVFGEAEYVAVLPIAKFADFDGPSPFVKALGEAGALKLHDMAVKCLAAPGQTYAIRDRPDLSLAGPMNEPPTIATVTTVKVAFGKRAEFEAILRGDVVPAMKKAGVEQFWVHEAVLGGDLNEWTIVTPFKSFAEFDKPSPLVRALGEEGVAKVTAKSAGIVLSMERSVMRFRPELSYFPEQNQ